MLAPEIELHRGLAPIAVRAHALCVDLWCEVVPGVGEYVFAETSFAPRVRREVMAALQAVAPLAKKAPCEIGVRVMRQSAGMAPTDTVRVSVGSYVDGTKRASFDELELVLPELRVAGDLPPPISRRGLFVVPSPRSGRAHLSVALGLGVQAELVASATDAESALGAAEENGTPFDFVFVDDTLPSHGLPFVATLRAEPRRAPIDVLVATASQNEDVHAWLEALDTVTVEKPILLDALRKLLVEDD